MLEIDAQAQLNPAAAGSSVGRDERRRDDSERWKIRQVEGWIQENRMVEGVEHIGRDFEPVFLTELRLLADAHVEAANAEAAHWPAPACSAVRSQEDGPKVLYSR